MINVSVIVPVYKVPLDYLKDCFDSLLAQTMQECEFIVVSDGAPEAEDSICEEYAVKDPRFKFYRREHAGVSATRNFAISQAQGEYITFVDSDDWIENESCELIYKKAVESNSDIILWECSLTDSNRTITKQLTFQNENKKYILSNALARYNQNSSLCRIVVCKLYKKSFLKREKILFNEDLSLGEDTVFNYQALEKGSIFILHESLYQWRLHENSASHKYRPDYWNTISKTLTYYKQIAPNNQVDISNSSFLNFIGSWGISFFNKKNKKSISEQVSDVKNLWKSQDLQELLTNLHTEQLQPIYRIEACFLKRNIFILLWLHAIKNKIF